MDGTGAWPRLFPSALPARPQAFWVSRALEGTGRQASPQPTPQGGDGRGLLGSGHRRPPSRARILPAGGGPGDAGLSFPGPSVRALGALSWRQGFGLY